jgi:hypothetical protein
MNSTPRLIHRGQAATWALTFVGATALAQSDAPFDRTPENCLSAAQIDRTRVIDDQTILFVMRNDRAYVNLLSRKCPGLAQQSRFSYEVTVGRLCGVDTITVLEQWAGRLEPGFTCRLGDFHPVSPEEVEDLEAVRTGRKSRDTVQVQPVARPEAETEAPADGVPPDTPAPAVPVEN